MATVEANGVTLGVEHVGDAAAPLVLLSGATTMLSWPDALCEALASGGRHVVRYPARRGLPQTACLTRVLRRASKRPSSLVVTYRNGDTRRARMLTAFEYGFVV